MELDIDEMVAKGFGSPPVVYAQLQKAVDNSESTFDDFEKIIYSDPALSARLLKIVNSPFYGFTAQVETLNHALSIIGIEQLSELALATGVIQKFQGIPADLVDMESFWKHSIAVGIASKLIAEFKGEPDTEKYYLAGMLHDVGSLLIFKEAPDKARDLLADAQLRKTNLFKVEQETLGFTHATLAATLMKEWKLPEMFVESIGFHHEPQNAKKFPLVAAIIHLADIIAYTLKLGRSGEPQVPELNQAAMKLVGLTKEQFDQIKNTLPDLVIEAAQAFK